MDLIHEIIGAGLGTTAGLWFVIGRLRSTMDALDDTLKSIDHRLSDQERHIELVNERLVRLETRAEDGRPRISA